MLYGWYTNRWLKELSNKEKKALKETANNYTKTIDSFMADITKIYTRLDKGEALTFADFNRFNDIEKIRQRIVASANSIGDYNRDIMIRLIEETYVFSYSFMSFAIENEAAKVLENATPLAMNWLTANKANKIEGLKLSPALQNDRAKIITGLQDVFDTSIKKGETLQDTIKKVQYTFDMSYNRAETIARTETHRVSEQGTLDSATNASKQGVRTNKTWHNVGDARVRQTFSANHVKLEGQTVDSEAYFDVGGYPAQAPGLVGVAKHDVRCRCYVTYEITDIKRSNHTEQSEAIYDEWLEQKGGGS